MKTYDYETTGKNILALAKERGYNATRLAKVLGVTPQAVSKWRRGIASPSIDNIVFVASLFEVRYEDIIVDREVEDHFDPQDK